MVFQDEIKPLLDRLKQSEDIKKYSNTLVKLSQKIEQLCQAEARTRGIIDTAVDAILVIDKQGIIQSCNKATQMMFDYTEAELLGFNVSKLMPVAIAKAHDGYLAHHLETGEKKVIGIGREVQGITREGKRIELLLSVSKIDISDEIYFAGILRDITAEKIAQSALEVSEAKLAGIVDTAVDAIIVINSRGIIQSCNKATQKLFGYASEQMIGNNVYMLMPDNIAKQHDGYLEQYQKTGNKRVIGVGREVIAKRQDGSEFYGHLSVSEVLINGERLFTGMVRDIDFQKKQALELATANQNLLQQNVYKDRLNNLHEGLKGDKNIYEVGQFVFEFFREFLPLLVGACYYNVNDVLTCIGQYGLSSDHPQAVAPMASVGGLVLAVYEQAKPYIIVNHQQHQLWTESSFGRIVPQQLLIMPIHYQGTVGGVIELGLSEEIDETMNVFLQDVLQIIGINLASSCSREYLRNALKQLQVQEEELRASNEELTQQTQALQVSEENIRLQKNELRAANESLNEKVVLIETQRQEIIKKNEDIEFKAKNLALSSQYKSEFLANMSHELRTPLNSLLLLTGGLAKNRTRNLLQDQLEDIDVIERSGKTLLSLINDILDLSKVEAGKLDVHYEPVVIDNLIELLTAEFMPIATQKAVEFIIENHAENADFTSDQFRIEQILRNLLSNAFKFTKQGQIKFWVKTIADKDDIEFGIEDTGIGIPLDKQQNIFSAFQQVDGSDARQYGGTGLGLTICQQLANLLGGSVCLRHSQPQKGSCFILSLPLQPTQYSQQDDETTELFEIPEVIAKPFTTTRQLMTSVAQTQHILIIEDDAANQQAIKRLLEANKEPSLMMHVAATGEEAILLLEQKTMNCMVLDYCLPDMDALGLLTELEQAQIPIPPLVIYTGKNLSKATFKALNQFTHSFVIKGKQTPERLLDEVSLFLQNVNATTLAANDDATDESSSSAVSTFKGQRILLVDDDLRNSFALSKQLTAEGLNVIIADNGKLALQKLIEEPKVELILMDIMMPEMDGYEAMQHIRQDPHWQNIPILALTAKALPQDKQRCLDAGANDYLPKPIDMNKLLDLIRVWICR